MKNPLNIIKEHFKFLISEYKYQIASEEFSPDVMGNAYVTYISASVGIRIVVDRNQVLINLGDITDKERDWFDFSDVLRFFVPSIENPYIFIEKTNNNKTEEIIEIQTKRLASLLQQYCKSMLNGEMWMKDKIKKIEKKRVEEMIENLKKVSQQHKKEN